MDPNNLSQIAEKPYKQKSKLILSTLAAQMMELLPGILSNWQGPGVEPPTFWFLDDS